MGRSQLRNGESGTWDVEGRLIRYGKLGLDGGGTSKGCRAATRQPFVSEDMALFVSVNRRTVSEGPEHPVGAAAGDTARWCTGAKRLVLPLLTACRARLHTP